VTGRRLVTLPVVSAQSRVDCCLAPLTVLDTVALTAQPRLLCLLLVETVVA
jgi:hypothetical protein